ncbi:MAG: hypothetical protein VCG02_01545, partial [Verrucomicrobiota bacterium]
DCTSLFIRQQAGDKPFSARSVPLISRIEKLGVSRRLSGIILQHSAQPTRNSLQNTGFLLPI